MFPYRIARSVKVGSRCGVFYRDVELAVPLTPEYGVICDPGSDPDDIQRMFINAKGRCVVILELFMESGDDDGMWLYLTEGWQEIEPNSESKPRSEDEYLNLCLIQLYEETPAVKCECGEAVHVGRTCPRCGKKAEELPQ